LSGQDFIDLSSPQRYQLVDQGAYPALVLNVCDRGAVVTHPGRFELRANGGGRCDPYLKIERSEYVVHGLLSSMRLTLMCLSSLNTGGPEGVAARRCPVFSSAGIAAARGEEVQSMASWLFA
jgi:hypothetical protein